MARNGSGTYSLAAGNPVVTGTTISSTVHNNTMTDLETAMTGSLAKNGETVLTGALDFNGKELILDADADTSITADTDDNIDFKVGGTDALVLGWQSTADSGFWTLNPLAFTADATENTHRAAILASSAITIPTGTTALVSSLYIDEPNITATGTVTVASTVYIKAAPSEGATNWAIWVDAGNVKFDETLEVTGAQTFTGLTTHGGNIVSDTDSTDDLGTTGVRWANLFIDDITVTTSIELGHDTDTSLTRVSPGVMAVEGKNVITDNTLPVTNDFRLSLTTGTAITTADVSAAATIYMTPYIGNRISVYTGSAWVTVTSAELSIAVSSTGNKVFDVFFDYNAGTPALKITDWTNDTTRATALTTQDGVLVQTGNTDWRYLGTARTKTASEVDDSLAFRHVWNYYNRVQRPMLVEEATNSWTYTTATLRQANGAATNQLDFVIGVNESMVDADVMVFAGNSTAGVDRSVGIGLDSTSVLATGCLNGSGSAGTTSFITSTASLKTYPGIGRHILVWLEYSAASGVTTWYGDNGNAAVFQSGIHGDLLC